LLKIFLWPKNLADKAAMSTILFLSAIKYAYVSIFSNDITASIKTTKKKNNNSQQFLSKEEIKKLLKEKFHQLFH